MKAFDRENSVWARFSEEQRLEMEEYSKKYRQFLDTARTERLANAEIIRQAEAAGFRPLSNYTSLKAGDKVERQVRHPRRHRHRTCLPGDEDRWFSYRLPPSRPESHARYGKKWHRLFQDPLLRRSFKISVGLPASFPDWRRLYS